MAADCLAHGQVVEPQAERLDLSELDGFSIDRVQAAVWPGVVRVPLAFGLNQFEVLPAFEIDRDIVIADATGQMVGTAQLQVQQLPLPITVDPEAECLMIGEIERR